MDSTVNGTSTLQTNQVNLLIGFGGILVMAISVVIFAATRSVARQNLGNEIDYYYEAGDENDSQRLRLTMIPIYGCAVVIVLNGLVKVFPKEHIKVLYESIIVMLSMLALQQLFSPIINKHVLKRIPFSFYRITMFNFRICISTSTHDLACVMLFLPVGLWYLNTKSWVLGNLIYLACTIWLMDIWTTNMVTSSVFLSGIFIYDILWQLSGKSGMLYVFESINVPTILMFPRDILENGFSAKEFSMLNLRDMAFPGVFIAFLLRFDVHLNRNSHTYFKTGSAGYISGFLLPKIVNISYNYTNLMHIIPLCLGCPILLALFKGDFKEMQMFENYYDPSNETEIVTANKNLAASYSGKSNSDKKLN